MRSTSRRSSRATSRRTTCTLQALDQIYVPKSQIANINVVVEQYIRNNIPVNSLGVGITPF